MRIAIVGINFHPEPISTGKYTSELAAYLAKKGLEVRVITAPPYYPQWEIQKPYSSWRYSKEQWQGVEIFRCPLWVPRRPTGLKRLIHLFSFAFSSFPAILAQVAWRPNVILCVAPTLLAAPFSLIVARWSRAPAWLHIQDFELEAAGRLGMLPFVSLLPIALKWEQSILSRFDRVSTISRRMLERLQQKGVPAQRTMLFPNWVDTEVIYPLPKEESLRHEWGIPEEHVVVLYAGNLGYKQGLENLLQAAHILKNSEPAIEFVICGDGAMRNEIKQRAKESSNVRLYPLQPVERLNRLLNSADIHVLPQRADAADLVMPSKLSGMLASGKPVVAIAPDGTEIAEVLSHCGMVVSPDNAQGLARAILEMARNPDLRKQLGVRGIQWVKSNWEKERVLGVFYRELMALGGCS